MGSTAPECPACGTALPHMPQHMETCRHCKEHITSRTRPLDDEYVVVTASQVQELEQQGKRLNEWLELVTELSKLTATLPEGDANWVSDPYRVLRERVEEAMEKQGTLKNWAAQCNLHFYHGELLSQQGQYELGVAAYCRAVFLALNGPEKVPSKFGQFSTVNRALPGRFLERLLEFISRPGQTETQLEEAFLRAARDLRAQVPAPLSPEVCWRQINQAFRTGEPELDERSAVYSK